MRYLRKILSIVGVPLPRVRVVSLLKTHEKKNENIVDAIETPGWFVFAWALYRSNV